MCIIQLTQHTAESSYQPDVSGIKLASSPLLLIIVKFTPGKNKINKIKKVNGICYNT